MNRIRAIATAGIAAGSLALAAAFATSGAVDASFTDTASAGASITVADHLQGLDDGCTFDIYVGNKKIDLSDRFDLSQFGHDDGNGNYSATFNFDFSTPNFDALWGIALSGGLHGTWSQQGNNFSVTFTWSLTGIWPLTGSAAITLTCTPDSGDDNGSGGGDTSGAQARSMSLLKSANDAGAQPQTISIAAKLDVPADPSACDPTTNASGTSGNDSAMCPPDPACDTSDTGQGQSQGCAPAAPGNTQNPDCAPGGADTGDATKCPPVNTPDPNGSGQPDANPAGGDNTGNDGTNNSDTGTENSGSKGDSGTDTNNSDSGSSGSTGAS